MFFILNKSSTFVGNKQDMIIVIFGQPGCGKTTLSYELDINHWILDGDRLRAVFKDKDFSREGRIKNLNRASDIAVFNHASHAGVTIAMVYPYEECRKYLTDMCKRLKISLKWVYLIYEEDRGKNKFKVEDFELPHIDDITTIINTSNTSIKDSVDKIKRACRIFS